MTELKLDKSFRPEAFQTPISKIVRSKCLNILQKQSGRILDVGCGNGIFLLEAIAKYPGNIQVFGIDRDYAALGNAKLVFKDNDFNSERFILGNAYQLPFDDDTFDAVFCINTLVNLAPIASIEALIKELHRICKKGKYIIFDYRNWYNPILSVTYFLNRITNSLSTYAYRWKQFESIVTKLKAKRVALHSLGPRNPLLATGQLVILEK
jgi:ubiquinone/menaquinone biosynthesis C-methylase UbiE